ncbi:arylsulfatase [Fulvivirgaceae bacterium BMA12]|uniref:Arylsulfatase n=1 Tax=Agaribacillus aureus TaxID=3051825 RepID=A0ABT8LCY5_9BACT|nr:arylsulfatase [Fulvivirgaceae bacterium BMA12]
MKCILYLCSLVFLMANCSSPTSTEKPNIILISVDDMGWSDLGCYGSEINTPNIDKLAEDGMRFTNFYNTAKCFPSRACLLTGVYAQDCGYDQTFTNPITNAVTLGEVLQSAGYLTYWAGKHHGKENPYDRGFDHYFGLKDGAFNHFNPGRQREGEPKPAQKRNNRQWAIDSILYQPYTPPEKDFYSTDYFTKYALSYLEESAESDKPFFLYLAYTAPHDPLMAWPEDIEKYKGKYDLGYEHIRKKRYEKQIQLGLIDSTFRLSGPTYTKWDSLPDDQKAYEAKKMEVYAAMIDRIDQNVGRLLRQLNQFGYADNTIILFVSDNGASAEVVNLKDDDDNAPVGSMGRWISLGKDWANVSNTPFKFYKNFSYEGGINTPFIAYWPNKIKANSFSGYPGHFIDFMATFVDITKAEYPRTYHGQEITPLRGQSLLPTFENPGTKRNGPLYWEWRKGQAMRMDQWKIVRKDKNDPWDLYHIENDPTETHNEAQNNQDVVQELDGLFQSWKSGYEQ